MIWPFTKKEQYKIPEFEGVRFNDLDGTGYEYCPTKDITPYELALLWPLAFTSTITTDRFAYIRKYNLTRFFNGILSSSG